MTNNRILKAAGLAVAIVVIFAIIAFRAAEWTRGLSSDFIVYGQGNTGSTGTSGSTGLPVQPVPLPPVVSGASNTVLDGNGDLFVFQSSRSTTGVTITGLRHSFYPPQMQVSVLRAGSSSTSPSVTYANTSIQVIGTGTSAIYAIATVYAISGTKATSSQSLIAILPGQPLPASLSGFPSQALPSPAEVKVGPSDYISVITESAATSTTVVTRIATVFHFVANVGGTFGSFSQVSSGILP